MYAKLVLAIPHATRPFRAELWSDPELVKMDADRWTDWYTDDMFAVASGGEPVAAVIGGVSRFDCDLERLWDDPLEQEGRGILYRISHSGATRSLTPAQQEEYLQHWHRYRERVRKALVPNSLLIDCHSFPSDLADIDICIGFNSDQTRPTPTTLDLLKQHFREAGFSVGINTPYSNSLAVETGFAYESVMIELNKRVYLNETDYCLAPQATSVKDTIAKLYQKILNVG